MTFLKIRMDSNRSLTDFKKQYGIDYNLSLTTFKKQDRFQSIVDKISEAGKITLDR